ELVLKCFLYYKGGAVGRQDNGNTFGGHRIQPVLTERRQHCKKKQYRRKKFRPHGVKQFTTSTEIRSRRTKKGIGHNKVQKSKKISVPFVPFCGYSLCC